MEKALFLLQDWLAVGAAVVVFSGIGLLIGKWIWGRQGTRLAKAVDVNMGLLGQWAALGQTQHMLFKKLRKRWQADRDSWGEQSAVWSRQLRGKDKEIGKLIAKVDRLKDTGPKMVTDKERDPGTIAHLEKKIEKIKGELRDSNAELSDVRAGYQRKMDAIKVLEEKLETHAASQNGRVELLEASSRQLSVLLRQRSIETSRLRRAAEEKLVGVEAKSVEEAPEAVSEGLQAKLDDAVSKVTKLQERYDGKCVEFDILENRLKKKEGTNDMLVADEIVSLTKELEDVRSEDQAKAKEIEILKGKTEEIESTIEDREREIEDAGKELKGQLHVISGLRSKIAELEGELDGQDVESVDLEKELKEKSANVEYLNGRISDMEAAMAERYAEVNRVRVEWKQVNEQAGRSADESNQLKQELAEKDSELERLSGELDEKISELIPLNTRLEELSKTLDEVGGDNKEIRSQLEDKELSLAMAEEGALVVRKTLEQHKIELKEAKKELSALKSELEDRAKSEKSQKAELDQALAKLDENDQSLAQRDKSIAGMEETVDRIEAEADSLKILLEEGRRNTADLESKIIEFEDLIRSKNSEIGVFTHEIRNLVETVDGPDRDTGGGGRSRELERLLEGGSENVAGETTKVHVRILSDTVADLQNRLVEAEGNFGACEKEKAVMHGKVDDIRKKFGLKLMSRDKKIKLLKREVTAQQAKVKELQDRMAPTNQEEPVRVSPDEKIADVANSRAVRNTTPLSPVEPGAEKEESEPVLLSVHFEEKSAELKASELSKIDEAARSFRKSGHPFKVSVEGFSGMEGSSDYNEFLSAGRADAVRERLIDVGVSQSLISTCGQGAHPDYADSSATWKARRVEISFVSEAVCEPVT